MYNHFKVYQSIFENESYVTELTDLQKVLFMLISSEMNRKEAASMATGKAPVMKFSHYWLSAALSSPRNKVSKALKPLVQFGFFEYSRGYNVDGKRTAPSTITNLAKEEFFVPIDRYTFEFLLYGKVKRKEIKYRHIVVYALCQYIEQFYGGAMTINEFGRKLGMTSGKIKYDRIKKPLEDLQAMNLVSFQKGRGKIEGVTVQQLNFSRGQQHMLREGVRIEAESLRNVDIGIAHKEVAASAEDMPAANSLDDVITNVKDIYAKQTGKKAILNADQKKRLQGVTLTIQEINQYTQQFLIEKYELMRRSDGKSIFSHVANYLQIKAIERLY